MQDACEHHGERRTGQCYSDWQHTKSRERNRACEEADR